MQLYPKYSIPFEESKITSKRTEKEIEDFYQQAGITIEGESVPKPMLTFEEWVSHGKIKNDLLRKNWNSPTPIQSAAWPLALQGRDLVGNVKTGSGKTLAFVLPAIEHIQAQPIHRYYEGPSVLVLSPSHELAAQTSDCFLQFGIAHNIKTALVCGGIRRRDQLDELKRGAHVYVATPGRLLDFIIEGTAKMNRVTHLVIDEADSLLDMGFEEQLYDIMRQLRPDLQTSMWTATMPEEAHSFALATLKNPVFITEHKETISVNPDIAHDVLVLNTAEKLHALFYLLETMKPDKDSKLLIFTNSKDNCDLVAGHLRQQNVKVVSLHGSLDHSVRISALQDFKSGYCNVAVATDLASRGIDFQKVIKVLNFDMPYSIENYVHRCGRTGRIGNKGTAITFFTPENRRIARSLVKYLKKCEQNISPQLEELAKLDKRTK